MYCFVYRPQKTHFIDTHISRQDIKTLCRRHDCNCWSRLDINFMSNICFYFYCIFVKICMLDSNNF
jgi:hypothetical protein